MGVLTAWMLAAGIQFYRDVAKEHRPPMPGEFIASGVAFGSLAILGTANSQLAGTLAWGFLLALVLQAGGPQNLVNGGDVNGPAGRYIFPKGAPPPPSGPQGESAGDPPPPRKMKKGRGR